LSRAVELYRSGRTDAAALRDAMVGLVEAQDGARLDYAELVDAETLEPVETVHAPCMALIAVRVGKIRLIDNMPLTDT
jgi:pantoate--beta-alanine ligase